MRTQLVDGLLADLLQDVRFLCVFVRIGEIRKDDNGKSVYLFNNL